MANDTHVTFGPFWLDGLNGCLWRDGQREKLTLKAWAVLNFLVERAGQVVTKDEVFQVVWPDVVVGEAVLTVCIRELRQALGDDAKAPRYIETVHRRGYRFIAPLSATPLQGSGVGDQGPVKERRHESARQPESAMFAPNPGPRTLTPVLVGREAELTQLHGYLEKALNGERQLVFVTGEPGIGKTALGEAFLFGVRSREKFGVKNLLSPTPNSELPSTPVPWFAWGQCIEQHGAGEAFLPILDALGRLCQGPAGEPVIEILWRHAPMWLVQLPTLVAAEEFAALQRTVQGATRERMLRELVQALEVLTAEQPLILVLEDLHWSDVSTLALLALLARRNEPARLLVIGTYRPVEMLSERHPLKGMVQELYAHELGLELPVGLLGEEAIAQYLDGRFASEVPQATRRHSLARMFHQRTGGNPLFLVSLVEDLVTQGVFVQTHDGWMLQDETAAERIPESIRHLVARQRERLAPVERTLLEAASVAGMEFSAATVAAALVRDTARVERRCEQLVQRQQFLKRLGVEEWPDGTLAARFGFRHALYQQLWHEQVSPTQLQRHHSRIGERKERAYGERAREIAAELALHFEQGRDYHKAIQYLRQAGENAVLRPAHQEAVTLLTKGVELLKTLPDTLDRARQDLLLQMTLGRALMGLKGYAAPEVERTYARALELSRQLGESPQLLPVLFGLLLFYSMRANLKTALELDTQLQSFVQLHPTPIFLVEVQAASGLLSFLQGDFPSALTSWARSLSLYEPQQASTHLLLYGQDPSIVVGIFCAFVYWLYGYPEQALRQAHVALTLAQALSHSHTQALTRFWAAALFYVRREMPAVQAQAAALVSLAREQGFAGGLAHGMIMQGLVLAEQGHEEEGIAHIQKGLAEVRAIGVEAGRTRFLALLTEAYEKAGRIEEGLNVLTEGLAQVERTGERYYEAELYRLKGELLLLQESKNQKAKGKNQNLATPHPQAEAEACFRKAIDIARRQQARMWELRATVSLARLWRQQGKKDEAHQMLSGVYGWFTEGFDTKDLQEARALLAELGEKER
jgi:DNA-binding winged helix-turn-helix (wHTH) protein/predicted ATPase